MNRGVSCGGGKSSLGYLFESGEAASSSARASSAAPSPRHEQKPQPAISVPDGDGSKPQAESRSEADAPEDPAPRKGDEQGPTKSEGGFITLGRPSTKVQSVPGGRSSLGYLFGDK